MIASGKSTYCSKKAKEGFIVINDDSIVNAVHAGNYALYDKSLKPLYKSIEDHILHTAIAMGKNVVIDRGLDVSASSRRRWISIAKSLDVEIGAIVFSLSTPKIHGTRRYNSDNRGHTKQYWINVAKVHYNRYEPPLFDEGFDWMKEEEWIEK